jgi:hypothetical protein
MRIRTMDLHTITVTAKGTITKGCDRQNSSTRIDQVPPTSSEVQSKTVSHKSGFSTRIPTRY